MPAAVSAAFAEFRQRCGQPIAEREPIGSDAAHGDSRDWHRTLLQVGWTMDDYEDWITRLLTLFLDPSAVE